MKLLSIAVPSYNSQEYLEHCVESLLPGGDEVEILIVDDGSKDQTPQIADDYEQRYPGVVRALHQPNKGHGGAVNTALAAATGLYFRVVDSDDWLDGAAYQAVLSRLKELHTQQQDVDLFLSNYVYEKVGKEHKKVIRYGNVLPQDRVFTWKEIGHFGISQHLLMHAMIYRTQLLQSHGLQLPEHTFYVDNIFCYVPLQWVRTLYYMDADLYRYFIGREDQSVNEAVMIKRIDQQLKVNKLMASSVDYHSITEPKQRSALFNYLCIITAVTDVLLLRMDTDESRKKQEDLWNYFQSVDADLYGRLRKNFFGVMLHLPGRAGRAIALGGYTAAQKIFGFN